jgi:RimJ/RimL family protein N-acetyltransferase
VTQVDIEPWGPEDLPLLRRLLGDPEMMHHLGGPESEAKIAERQLRYERSISDGNRMFKIVCGPEREPVGSVGYWTRHWRETQVLETGWSVLPAFQGRGIASAGTAQAIALARGERAHRYVHAFPSVGNAASNAICRKLGFELLGECELEYPPGNPMRCNDWRLDLRAGA